jgi:hypothetical protein
LECYFPNGADFINEYAGMYCFQILLKIPL